MRVAILTSGGDCQALNATMRGLVKALYQQRNYWLFKRLSRIDV